MKRTPTVRRAFSASPYKVRGPKPAAGAGATPTVSTHRPKCAAWQNELAREYFAAIVRALDDGPGASETHALAINLCAMRLADQERLTRFIDKNDSAYTVSDKYGNTTHKAYPQYAQRSDAAARASQALDALGLTPASIGRVKSGSGKGGQPTGFEDI